MLLEVLSDFQISIPELGVIEATTHPIVVLTSNNSRELTEALKRRCLYLWLDYPDVERELEIVRLHTPELDEALARRLVEVIHMVRDLDLKKPPSIAESIDWARALLLLGADDIDRETFEQTDDHHRQAPHRHRPRRRARRREARGSPSSSEPSRPAADLPAGLAPAARSPSARSCAREGVAVGTSELLDAFEALEPGSVDRPGGLPRGARGDASPSRRRTAASSSCSSTATSSAPPRGEALDRELREDDRYEGGERLDLEELREAIREAIARGRRRRDARPRAARDRRLRPPGRGLRRGRRRRAAHPPHARAPAASRARAGRRGGRRLDRERHPASSSATCAASSSAALIERTEKLPPSRPLAELDRALPTNPLRTSPSVHRAVAQLKRRLATLGHEQRGRSGAAGRRHAPDDARLARDRRRAAAAALPAQAPAPAGDLRALRRLDLGHLAPASSSSRCCTRSTTRSASCAASSSSSGSPRSPRSSSTSATSARSRERISQRGRRRRRLRLHRLRPRLARVPERDLPTTSTRARP